MSESAVVIRKLLLARVDYCLQISSVVVLYYDYILTLPAEIEHIWRHPGKLIAACYACCRYSLVANLLHLLLKTQGVGLSCNNVNLVTSIFSVFGHAGIVVVWGLRTYAICQQNKIVSAIVGFVGVSVVIMRIAIAGSAFAYVRVVGNGTSTCASPPYIQQVGLASAGLMMAFEGISFLLAAARAWRTLKDDAQFWNDPRSSLNSVIFSQGLLYITAVFVLSILTATFNVRIWGGVARPMNSLKLPLSALLTARFLLKIRMWEKHEITIHEVSTLEFNANPQGNAQNISYDASRLPHDTIVKGVDDRLEELGTRHGRPLVRELGRNIGPTRSQAGPELEGEGGTRGGIHTGWEMEHACPHGAHKESGPSGTSGGATEKLN